MGRVVVLNNPVKWALAAILLVSLAARLVAGFLQTDDLSRLPDQREYLQLGRNLLDGRGLQLFDDRFGQTVLAWRTPGYPAFVALCGADVTIIRFVQAAIDTSTVLAIFLLARRWLSPRGALLAAAIIA